jgi:hypothetical protein
VLQRDSERPVERRGRLLPNTLHNTYIHDGGPYRQDTIGIVCGPNPLTRPQEPIFRPYLKIASLAGGERLVFLFV